MGAVTGFTSASLGNRRRRFHWRGACIHALASGKQPLSVDVIEPSEKLGRGAAYGTTDPDHRINVPTERMSLFSSEPTHFTRWLFENNWLPDPESTDPFGRFYVPRKAFAAYLEATLAQTTRSTTSASLRHRHTRVIGLVREGEGFCLDLADGASLRVDRVAICTGHVPSAPCRVQEGARRHPRFIPNPWTSGSLAKVRKSDSVLIVGTGLTMVDVVATLERNHQGSLVAASGVASCPAATADLWTAIACSRALDPGRRSNCSAWSARRSKRALTGSTGRRSSMRYAEGCLRFGPVLPARERIRAVRRLHALTGKFIAFGSRRRAPSPSLSLTAQGTLTVGESEGD